MSEKFERSSSINNNSIVSNISIIKEQRWQFRKVSQNRLLNEFQLVCKSDKDYYKSEDLNELLEYLKYDYHKVSKKMAVLK